MVVGVEKSWGYASDLDLIFLMPDDAVEERDQLTRVAQRLQNWLVTLTAAGRAYDIDVRLRPDGIAGLLLSTVSAFAEYQQEKAWTWEHQALTRARYAAGDARIGAAFEKVRETIIAQSREWPALRDEIVRMRAKVSDGHPNRKAAEVFDIKHDTGDLTAVPPSLCSTKSSLRQTSLTTLTCCQSKATMRQCLRLSPNTKGPLCFISWTRAAM